MNPLTNVKNINKLNETELSKGLVNKKSWHDLYKGSAWIFIGGLSYGLTEGDILCVFSQYGEIVNINLVRDKKTGKIKGFCFLCYANQKSTILAVDNLNGIKICGRTIRVDHVANYKPPKDNEQDDEITKMLKSEGCAPQPIKAKSSIATDETMLKKKHKKHKKEKKKQKRRKREDPAEEFSLKKVKKEKVDDGYSKYEFPEKSKVSRRNESSEDESSDSSSESDSTCVSRKKKHESNSKYGKNHKNTNGKRSTVDKSRANKHDPRKEHSSSSDSDDNLGGKRKSLHANDHRNGLSSEEYSERHKKADRSSSNKDYNARSTSSRHFQHDSSPGSEKDSYPKQNSRTMDEEKEYRRDSRERTKNSYKDRKQQNPHSSYQDHRNRRSPHKADHHQNERRDYSEKYERFDKSRDNKREHGKHHFERRER